MTTEHPALAVTKIGGHIAVPTEVLADHVDLSTLLVAALNAPPLNAEQLATRQRERDERNATMHETWERLSAAGGLVTTIAELHEPIDGYCRECGGDDPPSWPCDTAQALIDHLEGA